VTVPAWLGSLARAAAIITFVCALLGVLVELAPGTPGDLVRDPETGALPACVPAALDAPSRAERLPEVLHSAIPQPWARSWTSPGCPSVTSLLAAHAPVSLTLGLLGLALGVPLGALAGFFAAAAGGRADRAAAAAAAIVSSTPPFVVALAALAFAYRFGLPTLGLCPDPLLPCTAADRLRHLVLPGAVLALFTAAPVVRLTRAKAHSLLDGELVRALRGRGLSEARILVAHALPLSLGPAVQIAALQLPRLVSGSVLIESVFGLGGMGHLLAQKAAEQDLPVLVAGFSLVAALVVLGQHLSDALSARLDPRLSL
jgi:oligopeptide transport system permease protein